MTTTSPQSIAVIGAGVMGSAIAARLLGDGHRVVVYDLDAAKVAALVAKGGVAAASPKEATKANFIILSLNSTAIVERAVFGENGVAESGAPGKLLIDMSSIDPQATRAMAARLKEQCGMNWVDCPLSGGAPGALAGRLTVMAGGSIADFERARSVMASLAANYTLMGDVGAGQTTKLVNQVLCAIGFQAVAEAIALAERGGVAADRIPAALAGGRADSQLLQEFGTKMARRDYSPTGRLDNMLKDLDSVQALARATKTAMPVTAAIAEIHRAFIAAGQGGDDNAALMRQFDGPKGG
jgi:2-hydroxy-3-oxopropionate reductase